MFLTICYGIIIGILGGFIWSAALSVTLFTGIKIGVITGLILAILIGLIGKLSTLGGNVKNTEALFVNGSILTVVAIVGIISGLLVWVARLIF